MATHQIVLYKHILLLEGDKIVLARFLHGLDTSIGRTHTYLTANAPHLLDEQLHHGHRLPHRQFVHRQVGAPILTFPQLEPSTKHPVNELPCAPYAVRGHGVKGYTICLSHWLIQIVVKLTVIPLVCIVCFLGVVCLQCVFRLICVHSMVCLLRVVSFQRMVAVLGMGSILRQFCDVGLGCMRSLLHCHATVSGATRSQCRRTALVFWFLYYLDVYHCSISLSVISAYPSSRLRLIPCTKKVLSIIGWR